MEFLRLAEYVDEPTPTLQEWMEHAKNFKDVNARMEQRRMEAEKRVQEVKMRLEKEKSLTPDPSPVGRGDLKISTIGVTSKASPFWGRLEGAPLRV